MRRGLLMRLVRQVKPGHEEITYIHLGEHSEEAEAIKELNSTPVLELSGSPVYPQELDSAPAPSTTNSPVMTIPTQSRDSWSSDPNYESDTPETIDNSFGNTPRGPYSPVSPSTRYTGGALIENSEIATSPSHQHRAFSFCESEGSSMVGKTPEQQKLIPEMPVRGQKKYTRRNIQSSTAKEKEREDFADIGLDIRENQTPITRTKRSQPDQKSSAWTDFDGSGEEDPVRLIETYFRWRDEHGILVYDGESEEPAHTESNFEGTVDSSLPQLATARSNTADEHEHLPTGPPAASPSKKSMSTEDFKEATANQVVTEIQVDVGQWTDLETPSTVTGPLETITTRPIVRERSTRHQLAVFALLVAKSILGRIAHCLKLVIETQLTTPAIPSDHVRIRWTCKCGKELFDDFVEKRTGAARQLEQYLNRPRQHAGDGSGSSSASGPSSHPSQTSLSAQSTTATSLDTTDISNTRSFSNQHPWTPSLSTRRPPTAIETTRFSQPL